MKLRPHSRARALSLSSPRELEAERSGGEPPREPPRERLGGGVRDGEDAPSPSLKQLGRGAPGAPRSRRG